MDKLRLQEKRQRQKKVVVTLRLPNDLHEKVMDLARTQNAKKSEVYREIISIFFTGDVYKM